MGQEVRQLVLFLCGSFRAVSTQAPADRVRANESMLFPRSFPTNYRPRSLSAAYRDIRSARMDDGNVRRSVVGA